MPCRVQVHAAIREKPVKAKKERKKPAKATAWLPIKSTYEERKDRLKAKLAALMDADDE